MPKVELVGGIESIEGWAEVARLLKQKMKKWGHQLTRDIETLTEKGQKNLGVIEKEVGRINSLLPDIWRKRTKYNKISVRPAENKLWLTTIRQGQQGGMKKGGVIRMEKLKPIRKTFTLTRGDSRPPFKEPSYRVCKEGKFYNFSSVSGVDQATKQG